MGKNLFSVPIFFIVFRETIEGALILAILLGFAHQIGRSASSTRTTGPGDNGNTELNSAPRSENRKTARRLARKLKIQVNLPLCFDVLALTLYPDLARRPPRIRYCASDSCCVRDFCLFVC